MNHADSKISESMRKMFQEVWSSSIRKVLSQLADASCEARVLDSAPPSASEDSTGVWVRYSAAARLRGEMAFFVPAPSALQLSELLTGQGPAESAEALGAVRESVAELIRRFVEEALPSLNSKIDGEVELTSTGYERPDWEFPLRFRLEIQGSKTPPLQICFVADQGLVNAAGAAMATVEFPPATAQCGTPLASPTPAFDAAENLGLLLDMELEAILRFGEREMLLSEILSLNAGSVVELNRRVNDPVDLLVCGKVVAKGEVVVLDGKYGLKVTQVGSPEDRMSSLRI